MVPLFMVPVYNCPVMIENTISGANSFNTDTMSMWRGAANCKIIYRIWGFHGYCHCLICRSSYWTWVTAGRLAPTSVCSEIPLYQYSGQALTKILAYLSHGSHP